MPGASILEIVDENDIVIGTRSRAEIHGKGLRHREAHVWFVTPDNRIVFQRRSATKDTYPNLLDASVGGHVEVGQTYAEAALMEVREEAGLDIAMGDLQLLAKIKARGVDTVLNKINATFREVYWMRLTQPVSSLVIEAGDGAGFEAIPAATVFALTPENPGDCIAGLFRPDYQPVWTALQKALS